MVEELLTPNDSQVLWPKIEMISLLEKTEVLRQVSMLDGIAALLQCLDKRVDWMLLIGGGSSARAMSVHLQLRRIFLFHRENLAYQHHPIDTTVIR